MPFVGALEARQRTEEILLGLSKENICAVVVTYFPDLHFPERLDRIRDQVVKTIIVDNTDSTDAIPALKAIHGTDIEIIRNKENLGIGQALNQGLKRAIELGYGWAVTFDQDSWIRPNLVSTLLDIYAQQPKPELVGIVGCNFQLKNTGTSPHKTEMNGLLFIETEAVITSGSLMPLAVFSATGPFRSDFFIDFVDHEYCLRLRKLGYRVVMAVAPLMIQPLGDASTYRLGGTAGIPFVLTNRSPLRRYYMTRNGILVAMSYFAIAPTWVLRTVVSLLLFSVLKIPLEKDARWKKFRATLAGAFDAFRSRSGKAQALWLSD